MEKTQTTSVADEKSKKINFSKFYRAYALLLALILIIIFFSIANPNFLVPINILNILTQTSVNGILAIGVTYVILTKGIDLGLGSYVAFTGVVAALFAQGEVNILIAIIMGLIAGAVIGTINGVIITKGSVAPFIVTLGMMTIARGAALVISGGRPVSGLSSSFNSISTLRVLGIPLPVIILLVVFLISLFLLNKTTFGRYVYAVGGNEEAAHASGIRVNKVIVSVYIIAGLFAGIAGIVQASRISTGQPNIGVGYELDAIAAVVIGGTSLMGGVGTVTGTLIGALIISVINNGLDLLNVSAYYQQIIKGIIIIGALLIDRKKIES